MTQIPPKSAQQLVGSSEWYFVPRLVLDHSFAQTLPAPLTQKTENSRVSVLSCLDPYSANFLSKGCRKSNGQSNCNSGLKSLPLSSVSSRWAIGLRNRRGEVSPVLSFANAGAKIYHQTRAAVLAYYRQ